MTKKEEKIEKINDEMELWNEKHSKKGAFITGLVFFVILFVICYYGYFYLFKNTNNYLDSVKNNVSSMATETEKYLDIDSKKDLELKGIVEIIDGRKTFDATLDIINSQSKDVASFNLDINQNKSNLIKTQIFVQDNKTYLETDFLTTKLIELDSIGIDLSGLNKVLAFNLDDFKYAITKSTDYLLESLKESSTSTTPQGLDKKEHKIVINDDNVGKVLDKLHSLIDNDKGLKNLLDSYEINLDDYIKTGEIKIVLNTFTDKIDNLEITTNDNSLKGIYKDNRLELTLDNTKIIANITDDSYSLEYYVDGNLEYSSNLDKENKEFSFEGEINDTMIKISLKKNDSDIVASISSENDDLNLSLTIIQENEKFAIKGTGKSDNLTCNINLELINEDDLIKRVDTTKAKSINNLSFTDQANLFKNILSMDNFKDLFNF